MQRVLQNTKITNIFIPVIAVIFGLIAGGIVMLVSGFNPLLAYQALFGTVLGNPYYIGETIRAAISLILSGLAVAFAFRTGLFNIGVEGQLLVGWFTAVAIGLSFSDLPKIILLPMAIIGSALAGGVWGFLPGFLKARFQIHEVITTIMMNYIALYVTNALIRAFYYGENQRTKTIPSSASLASPFLAHITNYSRLHWGLIVAILAAIIMWFLLWKTTLGFELRAVGFNPAASHYAGMNVKWNIVVSMVISGGFAGLAGAMEGLGTYQYMTISTQFSGIGFNGIAVALIGANAALGVVVASLFFAAMQIGALSMQSIAGVPIDLVSIIIALIIFFVGSSYLIRTLLTRLQKGGKS